MTIKDFEIGNKVKHINQDIVGKVVSLHYDTNEIIIKDIHSEYNYPDNLLIYRPSELIKFS
jgi:hypothetical protein